MMYELAKGTYSDLEVLIAILINPISNNGHQTRLSNRLFYWDKGALNKVKSMTTEN